MYIIFNKDGSVSESQLTDYINQHSDGVNFIDISIVGKSVDEYTADGNFKLPNNEVVSLTGAFTNKIKTSTGVYEGYRITLSSAVTEYQGDVALSIEAFNSVKTLFTYPVTLYVNETTGRGGDPITQDQYEALRAMMADYQLQYARSNMRSYDTHEEATEDLPKLSNGQMILAKETADSETSAVFQKVGDKLEGVSLDGLAVDKFLRNHNAHGSGDFVWDGGVFTVNGGGNPISGPLKVFEVDRTGDITLSGITTIGSSLFKVGIGNQPSFRIIYPSGNVTNLSFDKSPEGQILTTGNLGKNNGVASLDSTGKIPTSQLPSYVSDVLEFASFDRFPSKGEVNKIYIALDTNKTYRWGGTVYVEIGSSLALGETSETAYAGDKGKRNADNITALQSEKLNRKSGLSVTPETLVYACEAGGAESSYVDKYIKASLENIGNSIPIRATNGAVIGRDDQFTSAPKTNELITRYYGDGSYVQLDEGNLFKTGGIQFMPGANLITEEIYGNSFGGDGFLTIYPNGSKGDEGVSFACAGTSVPTGPNERGTLPFTGTYFGADIFGGGDLSSLNPAWKSIYGMVSAYQSQAKLVQGGFEALGFVNSKSASERASTPNPSYLTIFSTHGQVRWVDMAGSAQYDYQLPKKSGTIALTSDLSEAGTSVTIRRW